MHYVWTAIFVGPHHLLTNTQGGTPLPPTRSGGEDRPPETAAGLALVLEICYKLDRLLGYGEITKIQVVKVKI